MRPQARLINSFGLFSIWKSCGFQVGLTQFYFMEQTEIWKDIPGYEGLYQISDMGNVKSFRKPISKLLHQSTTSGGYKCVMLCVKQVQKTISVHRLVGYAFLNLTPDMDVDHINCNKADNRLCNLRVCTRRQNVIYNSEARNRRKSKYVGVNKNGRKWHACICINGVAGVLGYYKTEEEAGKSYQDALKNHLEGKTVVMIYIRPKR